jgi:HEAT repeat protein
MRYEAARAAGELEIEEAVPLLGRLILDDDREILEVVTWSLGEIGGKEAVRILEAMAETAEETDDDVLMEAIEDAIGNASLADGLFGSYDIDLDDGR